MHSTSQARGMRSPANLQPSRWSWLLTMAILALPLQGQDPARWPLPWHHPYPIAGIMAPHELAPNRPLDAFLAVVEAPDFSVWANRLAWLAAVVLLGSGVVVLWNLHIGRLVRRRTAELSAEAERRAAVERALRQRGAQLTLAQTVGAMGDWTYHVASGAIKWSENLFRLYGRDPALKEPSLPALASLHHPDDWPRLDAANRRALEIGEAYALDVRVVQPRGNTGWHYVAGRVERNAAGEIVRLFGIAHDISARKQAEEQLRALARRLTQEQSRLNEAQAVAKVGSWETNLETGVVHWSAETHRIFETDPATFSPTHPAFLTLVHPDDRAVVDLALQSSTGDCEAHSITHRILLPSGTLREVEERWHMLPAHEGQPARAVGTCQDITERKKLEASLLRRQRMDGIGMLAGGIAHNLNNLLAPVILGVGLIRHFRPGPEMLPVLDNMERSAKRGADLVKQVLAYARGVEGTRIAVDLRPLIHEVAAIIANTFPPNIVFTPNLAPNLAAVTGDPTQLNQVLLNLCVNARDAMPQGGALGLAAETVELTKPLDGIGGHALPGSHVCITVSDTGTGIAPELIDRIFEPFFTTKEVGAGAGLGLSTLLGIVRSHQGTVLVQSTPGQGAVFRVYLPACGPDGAEPAVAPPRRHGPHR